ncbi:dITP/XTP pyrophosphatase [bacterium HR29]|nr:dITP/XTP pyrophosphatase [bacterium HR29]
MPRLVLATNNPGKVAELRRLLVGTGYEVVTPSELGVAFEVDETGATYFENAAAKARAAARAAGCLALADDSGIEVDALGGRPGVQSARYGGEGLDDRGRVELLLRELEGVPDGKRTARFRAVVVIAAPDGRILQTFEGIAEGSIAREPRGAGGFGYDPVFTVRGLGKTMAELTPEEKDAVSHRGQAVRAAAAWLRARLEHG